MAPLASVVEGPPPRLGTTDVLGFVYLCLVGTAVAYLLRFRGIEKLPASAVSFLSPVVATAVGFVVLGEGLMLRSLWAPWRCSPASCWAEGGSGEQTGGGH